VARTELFERIGIRVARFTNTELREDLDSAPARIRAELRLSLD